MIQIRHAADRGHFNHGWLDTWHSFSFGDYHDPRYNRFRSLRVINEDRVAPGQGFGMHPHRDMEIVTYILSGALEHQDSMGNGSVLRAGELQQMSAGTGLLHSEFNPSPTELVHLYQIWLLPDRHGHIPSYAQRAFSPDEKHNQLRLVASKDGREDSLTVHQDASLYLAALDPGARVTHDLRPGRHAWLQVLSGHVTLNRLELTAGDGAAISDESQLELAAASGTAASEILLFDLP